MDVHALPIEALEAAELRCGRRVYRARAAGGAVAFQDGRRRLVPRFEPGLDGPVVRVPLGAPAARYVAALPPRERDRAVAAAAVLAAVVGYPHANRPGDAVSFLWPQHLALPRGEDPAAAARRTRASSRHPLAEHVAALAGTCRAAVVEPRPPRRRPAAAQEALVRLVRLDPRRLPRAERALVGRYRRFLEAQGREVAAAEIRRGDDVLLADLAVAPNRLVEAVASGRRADVRAALGKLLDERHQVERAGDVLLRGPLRLAVLAPEEPAPDVRSLLASLRVGLVVERDGGFVEL